MFYPLSYVWMHIYHLQQYSCNILIWTKFDLLQTFFKLLKFHFSFTVVYCDLIFTTATFGETCREFLELCDFSAMQFYGFRWRQNLTLQPQLGSNSGSSCSSLLNVQVIGLCLRTWLIQIRDKTKLCSFSWSHLFIVKVSWWTFEC